MLSLDGVDSEYETEPHVVSADGDYLFTEGKWKGMVFHPYTEAQITELVQAGSMKMMRADPDGILVMIEK